MPFAYSDWRDLAERGHEEARRRSLYRQQYCGCIFSEYERYKDTGLHLYRTGSAAPDAAKNNLREAADGNPDATGGR